MRKIVFTLLTLVTASCSSINQMNANMEQTNVLMHENTQMIERSSTIIAENTRQIERSTEAMRNFQFVFPIFFSILLLIFIYMIFRIYRLMVKNRQ